MYATSEPQLVCGLLTSAAHQASGSQNAAAHVPWMSHVLVPDVDKISSPRGWPEPSVREVRGGSSCSSAGSTPASKTHDEASVVIVQVLLKKLSDLL
ncbi:hypothetical protein BDV12DRAFT_160712, partial [Aspergillus spectabilis]